MASAYTRERAGWQAQLLRSPVVSPENRRANIADELQASDEAMRAAGTLSGMGLLRDAASRLYYAIYHAAVAVLLTEEMEPRTHKGVLSLLGLHFIKPGKLPPDMSPTFRRMQAYREAADVPTAEEMTRDIEAAKRFIILARDYLCGAGY